jgi:hypothetical protein
MPGRTDDELVVATPFWTGEFGHLYAHVLD